MIPLEKLISQYCIGRKVLFIVRTTWRIQTHGVDKTQTFLSLNLGVPEVSTRLQRVNFVEVVTERKYIVVYILQRNPFSCHLYENDFALA